jgi:hypothetical protein
MAAIEEARMVLLGIQALFGFQLIAAFNDNFKQLTGASRPSISSPSRSSLCRSPSS